MDWFERLTGFSETSYQETRNRLRVESGRLHSLVNGRSFNIGELQTPSLAELRTLVHRPQSGADKTDLRRQRGEARDLHRNSEFAGALFQVASQFNLLEMVDPSATPEDGVTRYQWDNTQGPACAIAAGAATIYRNYFAPTADGYGQTADRQLDMLADLGAALSECLGMPALYRMQNGYALADRRGLAAISAFLVAADDAQKDALRTRLRIGLHLDVDVTDVPGDPPHRVSQAFCSALPVAYSPESMDLWEPFARLVLEATYEATILAGVLNHGRGGSNVVLLTRVGGGAFGNDPAWIDSAINRALDAVRVPELDVRLVVRC